MYPPHTACCTSIWYKIRHFYTFLGGDSFSATERAPSACPRRSPHSQVWAVCSERFGPASNTSPAEEILSPDARLRAARLHAALRGWRTHAQNTITRPSPRALRLPRDALGSLSMPHMRGTRTGGARGSYRDVPGVYVKNPS